MIDRAFRIFTAAILCVLPAGAQGVQPTPGGLSRPTPVFELSREGGWGYRIPSLLVTRSGRLLAICERRVGLHDHAENDIVLRASDDGGESWSELRVLADEGPDSLNDPCVTQLASGRILLVYQRFPQGIHARKSDRTEIAEPGYDGARNTRSYLIESDDDGRTWGRPREITKGIRPGEAISVGGPGVAIQLTRGQHVGRVLLPTYRTIRRGESTDRYWVVGAAWSDDEGRTWKHGDVADEGGLAGHANEPQLVELADGSVLMSARNQGGALRKMTISRDGGATWSTIRLQEELRMPACMGSLIRYSWPGSERPGVLLHALPYGDGRSHGTIFLSEDEGETWPVSRELEPGGFAYSCLARLPDGAVGILYETAGYRSIVFRRFTLGWVRGGER